MNVEKKKWMIKLPPEPTVDDLPSVSSLRCGCSCETCISNYKELILTRHQLQGLQESLNEERAAASSTIDMIKEFEKTKEKEKRDLNIALMAEKAKTKQFSEGIENERKAHLEMTYKLHRAQEEYNVSQKEITNLKTLLESLSMQVADLASVNKTLSEKLEGQGRLQRNVFSEMENYESELRKLEGENSYLKRELSVFLQYEPALPISRPMGISKSKFQNNASTNILNSSHLNNNITNNNHQNHHPYNGKGIKQSRLMEYSSSYQPR